MGWLGFSPPFGDDYGCPMCMYRMWKLWTHGDFVDSCSLVSLPPFLESTLRTGVGPWLSCAAVPPTRIVRAGTDRPLACPSFRVPEPARCVKCRREGQGKSAPSRARDSPPSCGSDFPSHLSLNRRIGGQPALPSDLDGMSCGSVSVRIHSCGFSSEGGAACPLQWAELTSWPMKMQTRAATSSGHMLRPTLRKQHFADMIVDLVASADRYSMFARATCE